MTSTFLNSKILHDQPSTFLNETTHDNLQHFLTTKLLHDQPSTFLNNKATTEPTSRNTEQRNYYMTNLQHFLTTKLLHDQTSSTLLNNKQQDTT